MAEPSLFAASSFDLPLPFPDLPDPDFAAGDHDLGDDFVFDPNFDLNDLDFLDVDVSFPPPLPTTSSSSDAARSPDIGSSFSCADGDGNLKNESSSSSSSRSADPGNRAKPKEEVGDEAKRRARLVRNRESAHLSRQRKKQYVEELEGKLKVMQATIADLTAKITCVNAENAALRQQLGAGAQPPTPVPSVPPVVYPAFYPLPPPWINPAYAMRGSQVPLVPIPRLKSQQPSRDAAEPPAKKTRRVETKTKKVASVSLLGFLCVVMVCGIFVPSVIRMCGARDAREGVVFGSTHHGRVLAVEGHPNRDPDGFDSKHVQNTSETLPALLYLPRNGKHVKINGNLVLNSIVASEKATQMANVDGKSLGSLGKEETSLAIPGYVSPLEGGNVMESTKRMKDRLMTLAPRDGSIYREDDGLLPQWFSEAMSGPMLTSGMCTEVFQFDVSPAAAHANGIAPVYSTVKSNSSQNSVGNSHGRVHKMKNRRILYSEAIPLKGSTSNDTEHLKAAPKNDSYGSNKPVSSVVVSVLADPREAGDEDNEGRISSKSLSRIFVVVLIDSVKYVTYSCVLPFKNHSPHL